MVKSARCVARGERGMKPSAARVILGEFGGISPGKKRWKMDSKLYILEPLFNHKNENFCFNSYYGVRGIPPRNFEKN